MLTFTDAENTMHSSIRFCFQLQSPLVEKLENREVWCFCFRRRSLKQSINDKSSHQIHSRYQIIRLTLGIEVCIKFTSSRCHIFDNALSFKSTCTLIRIPHFQSTLMRKTKLDNCDRNHIHIFILSLQGYQIALQIAFQLASSWLHTK